MEAFKIKLFMTTESTNQSNKIFKILLINIIIMQNMEQKIGNLL